MYRSVPTTSCSLTNCLPQGKVKNPIRLHLQKRYTNCGQHSKSAAQAHWLHEVVVEADKIQVELWDGLCKLLWDGLWKRMRDKIIDWMVTSIIGSLLCACGYVIMLAFDINLNKEPGESPESTENRDALNAMGDLLKIKDNRVENLQKSVDDLLKELNAERERSKQLKAALEQEESLKKTLVKAVATLLKEQTEREKATQAEESSRRSRNEETFP